MTFAALLLAQTLVRAPQSAGPLPAPTSVTSPAAGPPALAATPAPAPGDAVITNSGSTNTAPYTIVVSPGGSADVTEGGAVRHATVGRAQTDWLFAKLREDAPVDAIPTAHCMLSASFGTVTRIAYRGATTGDLGCGRDPRLAELRRTVAAIVGQLDIRTRRFPNLRAITTH